MKNLETLIQELCPDGVEFVKLGDVCEIKGRIGFRGYTRKDLVSESEGAITLSPSNIINGNIVYDKCSYISWAKYEESPEIMAEVGDVVFTKTASVGKTAYIENMPKEMTINPQLVLLKKFRGISKYLAYILKTTYFYNEVKKITGVGSVPNVPQSSLAKIEIPLPPIEVQAEIVRILDKFTSLEAELEAELDCRKRQYEYYRDKLLSFDNMGGQEVEWKKMSEVCEIKGRIGFRGYTRQDLVEEGKGAISLSPSNIVNGVLTFDNNTYISWEKYDESPEIIAKIGNIVFTKTGSVGKTALITELPQECTINPQLVLITCMGCNNAYLKHVMQNASFQLKVRKFAGVGSVPNISQKALASIEIPIPPVQEQERIVTILDRFEALTTSLQSGLPAEIAARRQQYEHYRDKLLTFKRKGAA